MVQPYLEKMELDEDVSLSLYVMTISCNVLAAAGPTSGGQVKRSLHAVLRF